MFPCPECGLEGLPERQTITQTVHWWRDNPEQMEGTGHNVFCPRYTHPHLYTDKTGKSGSTMEEHRRTTSPTESGEILRLLRKFNL